MTLSMMMRTKIYVWDTYRLICKMILKKIIMNGMDYLEKISEEIRFKLVMLWNVILLLMENVHNNKKDNIKLYFMTCMNSSLQLRKYLHYAVLIWMIGENSPLITMESLLIQKILLLESIVKQVKCKYFMNILFNLREQFKTLNQHMKNIWNQTLLQYGHFIPKGIDKIDKLNDF